jgi:hypothetical protein
VAVGGLVPQSALDKFVPTRYIFLDEGTVFANSGTQRYHGSTGTPSADRVKEKLHLKRDLFIDVFPIQAKF